MNHIEEAKRLIALINEGDTAKGVEAMFNMKSQDAFDVLESMKKLLKKSDYQAFYDAVMATALTRSVG